MAEHSLKTLVFVVASAWGLAACQTGGRPEVQLPAVLSPLFVPCQPLDGAATLQAFAGDRLIGSAEMEWLARSADAWDVEVVNNAGLPVAKLNRRGASLKVSGPAARGLPPLTIGQGGYLALDGNLVGLKAQEVPCLLSRSLPRSWVGLLQGVETEGARTTLWFGDEVRDIVVTTHGIARADSRGARASGEERVCTEVSWRRFLIFTARLHWCSRHGPRPETVLGGVEDFSLKWVEFP